ncbi:bifunctional 5,10-methylenetetrahydrofolate dehydrogenase/5,10-methenyltetrahydrofolate cyclohydrolase [Streptomyces sp. NPDC057474]|uniref:bifunctional 5,10-methylenetetrahydrofolate dehydrogenase/5,10-methenyltetrahydrofolate cyclohydrolase n=1 Tax=Streptomyces sp. NPDC057474 TaxID=3346144 RepID=UPI0036CF2980
MQFPPPAHLQPLVQRMDPAKDIDALTKGRSPYNACATAEGICRVVEPFAKDDPVIAVVGSKGFVGQGVVTTLREQGHRLMELDAGDDLRRVRDADIVVSVTGNPGILGPDHLRPHHRLVVDSGFVPQADGSVKGDVQRSAYDIPQHLTPVPGGIGPVEMATLMERVVRREVDPAAPAWKVEPRPYQTKEQLAHGTQEPPRASVATGQQSQNQRQPGQQAPGGQTPSQPAPGQQAPGQQPPGNPIAQAAKLRTWAGNGGLGPGTANPTAGPSAPARAQLPNPPKPPTQAGPSR